MRRVILFSLAGVGIALSQAHAPIPPDLKFEVASLKVSRSNGPISGIRPAPGGERYEAAGCPVKLMIQVAYRVKADQIVGGPAWMDSERFDMNAKAAQPSSGDELHVMLMNLLAERFQLKFHKEKKEMPIYGLTVDKGGPKLTPHAAANGGEPWIDQKIDTMVHVSMKATSTPMEYFAFRLSQMMDRPVVNLTGLDGDYNFSLDYTRDVPPGVTVNLPGGLRLNGELVDTSGPTVFAAVKKQLGLELKAQRGPADIYVIDHIEKLTEN